MEESEELEVSVHLATTGERLASLRLPAASTVRDLCRAVLDVEPASSVGALRLLHGGAFLDFSSTLAAAGLEHGDVVHAVWEASELAGCYLSRCYEALGAGDPAEAEALQWFALVLSVEGGVQFFARMTTYYDTPMLYVDDERRWLKHGTWQLRDDGIVEVQLVSQLKEHIDLPYSHSESTSCDETLTFESAEEGSLIGIVPADLAPPAQPTPLRFELRRLSDEEMYEVSEASRRDPGSWWGMLGRPREVVAKPYTESPVASRRSAWKRAADEDGFGGARAAAEQTGPAEAVGEAAGPAAAEAVTAQAAAEGPAAAGAVVLLQAAEAVAGAATVEQWGTAARRGAAWAAAGATSAELAAGHEGPAEGQAAASAKPEAERLRDLAASCRPTHVDQERGDGRMWIVVAGEGKGGIIVRVSEHMTSSAFPARLTTGTTIEELEVVGNRLHYKRIRGDGPDWGWVSIVHNEKKLVELYPELEKSR